MAPKSPASKKQTTSPSKAGSGSRQSNPRVPAARPLPPQTQDEILPNITTHSPTGHAPTVRAIAAIPMVHPPHILQPANVSYGQLNDQEAVFYIQADLDTLRAIVQSAPHAVRRSLPPTASYDVLLNEVFRLRQLEAQQAKEAAKASKPSPDQSLRLLMAMSTQEVTELAHTNSQKLKQLMHAALLADPSLQPRSFPLDNDAALSGIAITWQFQSYRKAHAFQQSRPVPIVDPPAPTNRRVQFADDVPTDDATRDPFASASPVRTTLPTLDNLTSLLGQSSHEDAPSIQVNSDDSSNDDPDFIESPAKKHKLSHGPAGFAHGAGAAAPRLPKKYPGKDVSAKTLNVRELLGTKILATWLAGGSDMQTFLARFNWRRSNGGFPSQSEIEAHTLGRIVHLEMLACRTPREALASRPSLEVTLRRLYAILFVEEGMNSRKYVDRGTAWSHIEFILETHPTRAVMCQDITDERGKHITRERKREVAVRATEQSRAARRKQPHRHDNHTPPPTPPRKTQYKR